MKNLHPQSSSKPHHSYPPQQPSSNTLTSPPSKHPQNPMMNHESFDNKHHTFNSPPIHDIHHMILQCKICRLWFIQHNFNPKPRCFNSSAKPYPNLGVKTSLAPFIYFSIFMEYSTTNFTLLFPLATLSYSTF